MLRARSLQVAVRGAKSRQNGLGSSGSFSAVRSKVMSQHCAITIGRVSPSMLAMQPKYHTYQ